jgi:hypothetical protein
MHCQPPLPAPQLRSLRTEYCRMAFQSAASNSVRVSIDQDMLMIDEASSAAAAAAAGDQQVWAGHAWLCMRCSALIGRSSSCSVLPSLHKQRLSVADINPLLIPLPLGPTGRLRQRGRRSPGSPPPQLGPEGPGPRVRAWAAPHLLCQQQRGQPAGQEPATSARWRLRAAAPLGRRRGGGWGCWRQVGWGRLGHWWES